MSRQIVCPLCLDPEARKYDRDDYVSFAWTRGKNTGMAFLGPNDADGITTRDGKLIGSNEGIALLDAIAPKMDKQAGMVVFAQCNVAGVKKPDADGDALLGAVARRVGVPAVGGVGDIKQLTTANWRSVSPDGTKKSFKQFFGWPRRKDSDGAK